VSDYAATLGFKGQLMPWDWSYYTEKYKDEKYALNDELVKPYLKLENVKKGVFMRLSLQAMQKSILNSRAMQNFPKSIHSMKFI